MQRRQYGQDATDRANNPDQNFRWDPTAQQWIFNYSTKLAGLGKGTYSYSIVLNDNTSITVIFGLK